MHRGSGVAIQAGAGRGDLHERDAVVEDRVLDAQEQDRQLFLGVRTQPQDGAALGARLVNRRAGEVEHLGRQPVTKLSAST